MNKKTKKIFTLLILSFFILWIWLSSFLYFSSFDFENFFWKLELNMYSKVWIILIIYFFRNYLLIPSTLIILFAGFFLQNFWITLMISIIWVSIWICQTYFVWYIFWEDLKNNKNFKLISKYNDKIQKDWFKVIFLWAFFPVIPVDILYYSAWFVKYNFLKSYLAWIIWEMPLIILYVYLWKQAHKYSDYLIYIALWILLLYLSYQSIKKLFFSK